MNPEQSGVSAIGLQAILTTHLELSGSLIPVCFQIHAPEAAACFLIGEMTDWQTAPIPMQRDDNGVWHTRLRLRQGQWLYKFLVDGQFVPDPANPLRTDDGWGGFHSYMLIGDGDWAERETIAYGEIVRMEIDSTLLQQRVGFHLYLPPGYALHRPCPLLYLLHGYRMQSNQWHANGMVRQFMGNLLAQSLIEPFLIVMPDTCTRENAAMYARFLADELYPWLERMFAIRSGPASTAVAGMSQFSLSAFALAHENPHRFGFVAPVSGFYSLPYLAQLAHHPLQLCAGIKVYCGTEDYVFERNECFAGILRNKGVRFDYMRINGDHTWHYWNSITRDLLMTVSEFFAGHKARASAPDHDHELIYE